MLLSSVCAVAIAELDEANDGDDPSLITVEETLWGFDGTIVPQHFNVISIRFKNSTAIPWSGTVRLQQMIGQDRPGLVMRQELNLGPQETRWVQFTPYLTDTLDIWKLDWGGGEFGKQDIAAPVSGQRATVLMYDVDAVTPSGGKLRRMPDELMPQSITALSGLRGMILDHTPFWTGARSRTLMEWLNQGGRLYLLHNSNGQYPVFPESQAVLNQDSSEFQVGLGTVKRLPIEVRDLTLDEARLEVFNDELPLRIRNTTLPAGGGSYAFSRYTGWARDEFAFRQLRSISIFQRPWLWIYVSVIAYLLALFPGCYRLGTQQSRVGLYYIGFFGVSLLFSIVFIALGQVGASERSRLRSIGTARMVTPGVYDVSCWTMACVKDEGDYTLELPGTGACLAPSIEGANTAPFSGTMDIETAQVAFSMAQTATQAFLERNRVSSDMQIPALNTLDVTASRVVDIRIDPGPDLASSAVSAWLVRDQVLYPLNISQPSWTLDRTRKIDTVFGVVNDEDRNSMTNLAVWQLYWLWLPFGESDEVKVARESEVFKQVEPLLIGEAFGQTSVDFRRAIIAPGTVRILVHARIPQDFQHGSEDFPDQRGSLMFSFDVPDPTLGSTGN